MGPVAELQSPALSDGVDANADRFYTASVTAQAKEETGVIADIGLNSSPQASFLCSRSGYRMHDESTETENEAVFVFCRSSFGPDMSRW